jgi:hypothetical protein
MLSLAVATTSCSREPKCHGAADSDEIRRMQKLVEQGKDPCPMYLAPKIAVDQRGVELNGRRISGHPVLPIDGAPGKIPALFAELKMNREAWKTVHPAMSFDATAHIDIPAETDFAAGASAILTAAFAGYPRSRVRSGGVDLALDYDVPRPPHEEEQPPSDLYVERSSDGRYDVYFQRGRVRGRAPEGPLELDSIPSWVDAMCPVPTEPCVDAIMLRVRGEFVIAATLLQRLQRTRAFSQRPPRIRLRDLPR